MKPTYEIVVDDGKPYSVAACGWKELKARLTAVYNEHFNGKETNGDCYVYAPSGEDISDTVFVREIIDEILAAE
jgi:hypothetical protein